jgi:hypothetical protein
MEVNKELTDKEIRLLTDMWITAFRSLPTKVQVRFLQDLTEKHKKMLADLINLDTMLERTGLKNKE